MTEEFTIQKANHQLFYFHIEDNALQLWVAKWTAQTKNRNTLIAEFPRSELPKLITWLQSLV